MQQRIDLAVSTVIFALRPEAHSAASAIPAPASPTAEASPSLWIPLVRRTREPFRSLWALPGGPLEPEQELGASAAITLDETTGLRPRYLEQLYAFGDVDRSPGGRTVSIVYWALVRPDEAREAVVTQNVRWFPVAALPELAFDHAAIIAYAVQRLQNKLGYTDVAAVVLGDSFTLAQLREVHEAVQGHALDPANFRRSMLSTGRVVPTGASSSGDRHRPAKLYRSSGASPWLGDAVATTDRTEVLAENAFVPPATEELPLDTRVISRPATEVTA